MMHLSALRVYSSLASVILVHNEVPLVSPSLSPG